MANAHFLTASTYDRRPAFTDPSLCAPVTAQLLQSAAKHGFAVFAYCLMPDHVHVLVEAERADADFVKWAHLWRQLSGFWERQRTGRYLWQEGYWDHTLRDDESLLAIAAYIVLNPVRAGLVASPEDYPFSGSSRFSVAELATHEPRQPFSDIHRERIGFDDVHVDEAARHGGRPDVAKSQSAEVRRSAVALAIRQHR